MILKIFTLNNSQADYIVWPLKGRDGRVVRLGSAKPATAVRFRFTPPVLFSG